MKEVFEVDLRGSHGANIVEIQHMSLSVVDYSKQYDDGGVLETYELSLKLRNGENRLLKFSFSYGGIDKPGIHAISGERTK